MLEFKQDDTAAELILTLTEKVTVNLPYYFFEFTHVTTRDVVSFLKSPLDDESEHPNRYNKFTIDSSVLFAGMPPGEWHYRIFQINTTAYTVGDHPHNVNQVQIVEITGQEITKLIREGIEYTQVEDVDNIGEFEFFYNQSTAQIIFGPNLINNNSVIYINTGTEDIILEFGKLMLLRAIAFEFTQYDTQTTYKQYNG